MNWNTIFNLGYNAVGLFSSLFGKKSSNSSPIASAMSAKAYQQTKDLSSYNAQLDYDNFVKQLRLENQYNMYNMSASAKATQALNQNLMDYQYGLERQSRQSSFQDTRKDLISAGYNPMLAIGQQSNYTPVSSGVSATSDPMETMGVATGDANAGAELASTFSAVKRNSVMNKLDKFNSRINANKSQAEIGNILAETVGRQLQNKITGETGMDTALAQLQNIKSQTNVNRHTINKIMSEVGLNQAKTIEANSQTALNNSAVTGNLLNQSQQRFINNQNARHPYWNAGLYWKSRLFGGNTNIVVGNTYNGKGKGAK